MTGFFGMPQFGFNSPPVWPQHIGQTRGFLPPAPFNAFSAPQTRFPFGFHPGIRNSFAFRPTSFMPQIGFNGIPLGVQQAMPTQPVSPFGFGQSMLMPPYGQMPAMPNLSMGQLGQATPMSGYRSTVDILQDPSISAEAKSQIISERYGNTIMAGANNNPKVQALFDKAQASYAQEQLNKQQEKELEVEAKRQQLKAMKEQLNQAAMQQTTQPSSQEFSQGGGGFLGGLLGQVKENPEMLAGLLSMLKPKDKDDESDE